MQFFCLHMATADRDAVRVLCVDDEPGLADLVAMQLEQQNNCFSATALTAPEKALNHLAESPVDAIVSDHEMPNMSGLDLLESVRADNASFPFILYTGKGSEE